MGWGALRLTPVEPTVRRSSETSVELTECLPSLFRVYLGVTQLVDDDGQAVRVLQAGYGLVELDKGHRVVQSSLTADANNGPSFTSCPAP